MPEQHALVYLMHMRDCCEHILEYTKSGKRASVSDPMVLDAVCRNLEILGEAAKRMDPEFRAAHPGIPWRKMAGARDILIHVYEETAPEIVWDIVETDIPALLAELRRLLGEATR
jgi:uncharacterized protein with HEPN domain